VKDLVRTLTDALTRHLAPSREETVVVRPHHSRAVVAPETGPMVIGRQEALTVTPVARPAWDAKGWIAQPHGRRFTYEGFYEATLRRSGQPRRFRGRLIESFGGIATYIADPPTEIRRHPKGPCFALVEAPWFRVHWQRQPRNVDEAILYVETVLDEALNQQ
jgi:hypothetical protein